MSQAALRGCPSWGQHLPFLPSHTAMHCHLAGGAHRSTSQGARLALESRKPIPSVRVTYDPPKTNEQAPQTQARDLLWKEGPTLPLAPHGECSGRAELCHYWLPRFVLCSLAQATPPLESPQPRAKSPAQGQAEGEANEALGSTVRAALTQPRARGLLPVPLPTGSELSHLHDLDPKSCLASALRTQLNSLVLQKQRCYNSKPGSET